MAEHIEHDDIEYVDRLLNGGRLREHVCGDGTVVIFPGDGTSHVDVAATERNQTTQTLRDTVETQGRQIAELQQTIRTMQEARRGPA
jgi:hypothetical protein